MVQNAFEKVVRHAASFDGRSRCSTWIHRIVTNEALMWLRSQRRRAEVQQDPDDDATRDWTDPAPGPVDALEQNAQLSRLREGIARLSHAERDVVERCALSGMSYAEYGERTGLHAGAVKSRAHRARLRLRDWLAQEALSP